MISVVSKQTDTSNVKWSAVQIARFLRLLKKYQILWRLTDKDRKSKRNRDAAFHSLVIEARQHVGPKDLDMLTMKSKMKNLKTVYTRERGKVLNAEAVGEKYVPGLRWYSVADSFLRYCNKDGDVKLEPVNLLEIIEDEPHIGSTSDTESDCEVAASNDRQPLLDEKSTSLSFDIDQSGNVNVSSEKHYAVRKAILSLNHDCPSSEDPPNPKSVKRKHDSSASEDFRTLRNNYNSEDKYYAFGMYVAAELRQLNDDAQLKLAKHYINSILFDASMSALIPP